MISLVLRDAEKLVNGCKECNTVFLHLRKYFGLRNQNTIYLYILDRNEEFLFPSICLGGLGGIILTILWITAKFLKFLECKIIWGFSQKKSTFQWSVKRWCLQNRRSCCQWPDENWVFGLNQLQEAFLDPFKVALKTVSQTFSWNKRTIVAQHYKSSSGDHCLSFSFPFPRDLGAERELPLSM